MLPSFLYPSYKQYKADTDNVATWLADTAKRCGYPSDLLNTTTPQPPQKAPKLKGRARKLARDAAKSTKADTEDTDSRSKGAPKVPKYLISVNDFITLADWIAKSAKPPAKVPSDFVSVLERAIAVRKQHVGWWYGKDKGSSWSSKSEKTKDAGHSYFVGVLEQVRDILRPRMESKPSMDRHSGPSSDVDAPDLPSEEQFINQFADIHIEHPHEDIPDPMAPTEHQHLSGESVKAYGVQQPTDIEEVYFAVHCLFNDFDNIRRYIEQVWWGYKQGVFDLIAASLTTNTAIDFARRLQEDFVEMFPEHTDFEKHVNVLFYQLSLSRGYDPTHKERPDDEMNFEIYDEADKLLFPAYMLVSSFNNVTERNSLPIYKPGHFGIYDASSERELKSPRDRFREDKVLLLESLPDFYVFAQAPSKIPAEDEMTRGVREMRKQGSPPFWLALAAQIFLDIHHTLREDVSIGFLDLVKSAKYVENSIQQVMLFHENLRIKFWPKSNDEGFYQILELITKCVNDDALQVARTSLTRRSQFQLPSQEPHRFLKNHPLYCGLLSFSIKKLVQDASIIFVNAWGSITYSAHLYNALRQEGLLSNSWKDIDFSLFIHKPEDIFIGDFPKNTSDYLKRFLLAMGFSATGFAKDRRAKGMVLSKAGPRCLNDISPVSAMFKSRYCADDDRIDLSPADVEIILQAHDDMEDDTLFDETGEWQIPRIKVNSPEPPSPANVDGEQRTDNQTKRRKNPQRSVAAGVRPIQLLNALLQAIQAEVPELSFDHLSLHTFTWKFLRTLQEVLDEDLKKMYGAGYLERENQLPFVVGYIFATAVNTAGLAGMLLPKKENIVTSRMLVRAAAVMKEMLDTGAGETELKSLKDFLGIEIDVPDIFETPGPSSKRA